MATGAQIAPRSPIPVLACRETKAIPSSTSCKASCARLQESEHGVPPDQGRLNGSNVPSRADSAYPYRMTRALATALCVSALWVSPAGAAGVDLRPELPDVGVVQHLEWNPDGNLWFGTDEGHVLVSRDGGHGWSEVAVTPWRPHGPDDLEGKVHSDSIHWIRFFDAQRGLALGWAKGGGGGPVVFRTADGGASWQPLPSPPVLPIEGAQVSPDGRAWLISDCGITVSEDYGVTWRFLTSPKLKEDAPRSILFSSPSEGFLGTWQSLFLTSDGGASWRSLPTPAAQGVIHGCSGSNQEIRKIRRWGGRLLIHQCENWFASPFPETVTADTPLAGALQWQPLPADGRWLFELEPMGERLLTIAGNGEILFLDRNLQVVARPGFKVRYKPRDIAVLGERVAIVGQPGDLTVGENGRFAAVPWLQEGSTRPTAPSEVLIHDRGADGSLWGLSNSFLQLSRDGGRTWERQAVLPYYPGGLALRASGEVLLWTREGGALSYDPRTSAFTPVPELRHLDIVGVVRRGPLWLAFGGWERTTHGGVVRSRDLDSNFTAGWANAGFLAISTDGGGHWQSLDNGIKESGVQAVFWGDDDRLTVLTWLGSIYHGKLAVDAKGKASLALTRIFHGNNAFGESVGWLDFLNPKEGWIRGWFRTPLGFTLFRTRDGGKSWQEVDLSKRYLTSLARLGGGAWLAQVRLGRSLVRWNGKQLLPDKEFDSPISGTWIDSTGGLVVKLDNEELWALDAAGKSWSQLR